MRAHWWWIAQGLLALSNLAHAQTSPQQCADTPADDERAWLNPRFSADCRARYVLNDLGSIERKLDFIESDRLGPPAVAQRNPWAELGLTGFRGSDGPAGNSRAQHVTAMPSPLTVAASFDPIVATEYGTVVGEEFHATGNNGMLGPAMDLARTWHFGRTPESFGEDPFLAASLVAPEVLAIQQAHVLVTLKHFAAYTQEQGRTGDLPFGDNPAVNVLVSERALHEVYLAPFRAAVEQGHAGAVMCAFPRINGVYACENPVILGLLKADWGFDGTVGPDFPDAQRSVVAAINAGLDSGRFTAVPKPPPGAGGLAALFAGDLPGHDMELRTAVAQGRVSEARLDDLIRRRLIPAFRVGVFEHPPSGDAGSAVSTAEHRQTAREIVSRGSVLLKNSGLLPLRAGIRRLAVIGAQAGATPTASMLGSGYVEPTHLLTAFDAIKARAGSSRNVSFAPGTLGTAALPRARGSQFNSADGAAGLQAQYFPNRALDFEGQPLHTRLEDGASINGAPADLSDLPPNNEYSVRWRGVFTAQRSGAQHFSIRGCGTGRLLINGNAVAEFARVDFGTVEHAVVSMSGGSSASIEIQWTPGPGAPIPAIPMLGTTLGTLFELGFAGPDSLMAEAANAAHAADAAVVFVSNRMGEGADRLHLGLPADQDAWIRAVAKANPRTIVVLNTGGAVTMPWLTDVAAVLEMWYPGDALGSAAADLLFGDTEPSGRLPLTFPADESQGPGNTQATYPGLVDQAGALSNVTFSEGSEVGYRYFETKHQRPLFPFGFGLSYTTIKWTDMRIEADDDGGATVTATVKNIGPRRGSETLQVYATLPAGGGPEQLKGFAKAELAAGASQIMRIKLAASAFMYWSEPQHGWRTAPGEWQVVLGHNSRDIVYRQRLNIADRN
jgi:beta-glucosidase